MQKKHVVIVGGGFGGTTAALCLEKYLRSVPDYGIILIDKNIHQLYTPALYEIATMPDRNAPASSLHATVSIPFADIIDDKPITFIQGELAQIDTKNSAISLQNGETILYEYLVLALGSETNYFSISGLKEYSFPIKTFADALRIRDKTEDLMQKNTPFSVVVGGAGPAGVELVAEFANFIECVAEKNKNSCPYTLVLVDAGDDILTGFPAWAVRKTKKRLEKIGVQIKIKSTITEVTGKEIFFKNGGHIPCDLLIWTGGVKAPAALERFGMPLSAKGNFLVNEFLEVQKRVFAIGDNAGFLNKKTGRFLQWNVPVAQEEARHAAKNIAAEINGKIKTVFMPPEQLPFLLAIGKKYAIADLLFIRFSGFVGWFTKLVVELHYLLSILPFRKAIRKWLICVKCYSSND